MNRIETLTWDSQFFGLSIGRLQASHLSEEEVFLIQKEAQRQNFQLVYFFLGAPLAGTKAPEGVIPMDGKVLYHKKTASQSTNVNTNINEYTEQFVDAQLYKLALQSGIYSRFKLDTCLPENAFERLYYTWIEKSVDGQLAEAVLVYRVGEELAGMVTLGLKPNGWGDIGLIAVDAAHRGQRIGPQLLAAAEQYFAACGISELGVETQLGNKAACRFYEKNGYSKLSRQYIYHLWL